MPEIWVCTAQPGDAALRSAAAACALELEHAVLSLLLAQMTVYDRTHVTLTLRGFPGKWCFARTQKAASP